MKALILAAGYATRLYPLTLNWPKPLLKVGNKAIIEYILEKINEADEIDEVFVVTNNKFYPSFAAWADKINRGKQIKCGKQVKEKKIKIINDGTLSNEDRLGAIGDIDFAIQKESIDDDLLVIAGDNLFGFSLQNFVDFFVRNGSSIAAFHNLKDLEKVRGKYGVGILDGTKIIDFEEKPMEPKSSLAATACYLFSKKDLPKIRMFKETSNADAPGNFIKYLAQNSEAYGFVFDDCWYDIGSFESLKEAEENLQSNEIGENLQ